MMTARRQAPPRGYNLRLDEVRVFPIIGGFWLCQSEFIGGGRTREEAIDAWAEDVIDRGHWVSSRYLDERVKQLKKRETIKQNRATFLTALKSGQYKKGSFETDLRGRPINPDEEGYCAAGLAHTLFCDETRPNSPIPMRAALGLSPKQVTRIQQDWNDTDLTFIEIADLIEREMFNNDSN